ncbi:MAG: tetratricopeptide repeat protein [Desulfovibrionaceae bacterium]|jgi:tetratricopeptide (TPR) repeat protein|nr:tetratricopeptide repeat protein [Desulfovibrionaceae bacterium]
MSNLDYEINKELGECYLFMGDYEKAEEYYTKAAGSNGVHPDPYLGLATIAIQRGDLAGAMALYKKAAAVEACDKALAGMALVEMETGDAPTAYEHFRQALEANPENEVALLGLIQTGHCIGRLEEVPPYLENALAVDPTKHDLRYSLAGCLANLDRKDEARRHLEIILESAPDHAAAQELYGMLA